ncbi:MAG: glycogen debranching enzyme family protein [Deltaproteobacteria bacterium]|nr:glycogen debranching enzyme family protein [Deltaproteobacteria bacterium]
MANSTELNGKPVSLPPPALSPSVARGVCQDFAQSSKLEWLETNGAGGFAMGTVAGVNTRRYHGLLVASLRAPVERHVLFARLEEMVAPEVPGLPDLPLSTAQYPGAVHPAGFANLTAFRLDPWPTWVFDVGGAHIEKQLFLLPGEQTVVLRYTATRKRKLKLSPFLAFRDYHALCHRNDALDGTIREERDAAAVRLRVHPYATLPELTFHASPGAQLVRDCGWHLNHELLSELDRGLDFREDLWKLGTLSFDISPEQSVFLVATTGEGRFDGMQLDELARHERLRRVPERTDPQLALLERAAEQFCVRRADGSPTVIAGYPWFTDWGRDTMISLPGLYLARGKLAEAREIIRGFLAHLDGGLIPNRFPDRAGEAPEYNTVDATLWMFQAMFAYLRAGGDTAFLRDEFYPAAREIISHHLAGTRHGIRVDPRDHLLTQGEPGVQLTWMDARVGDHVITPRHGKAVEINALWYNALRLMALWSGALGREKDATRYAAEADAVERSFAQAFWNAERGCLFDVVADSGNDASVRPNQLFALSLPFALLDEHQRRSVISVVEGELLTPFGLRTLASDDRAYQGRYRGSMAERDGAYHQGTVWPWLMGPFVRGYLRAHGRSRETLDHVRGLVQPLLLHLNDAGLGSISEVFDGDEPHAPGGCPAQAWSVAELLLLLTSDLVEPARDRGRRELRPLSQPRFSAEPRR